MIVNNDILLYVKRYYSVNILLIILYDEKKHEQKLCMFLLNSKSDKDFMESQKPTEHELDPICISPDQFLDCAQAIIHTILFHRAIDTQIIPQSVVMPGVDMCYASAETKESAENIKKRLIPLQETVFGGVPTTWIILTLAYNTPKKGWFKEVQTSQVWERWCITFQFQTLPAKDIRAAMFHAITQITQKANSCNVAMRPTEGSTFQYTINIPTDKGPETAELLNLVKKIVKTPAYLMI